MKQVSAMLLNRPPKKTERAQCLIERYEKEVRTDTQKRYYYPLLFSALNYDPTPGHIRYIGEVTKNLIDKKDAFFAANLMHSYIIENVDAEPASWKPHCTPDGCRALLICGSAHPNGYFREKCLKLLADERDVLQFILLRMNDWVPAIRRTAWAILQEHLQSNPSCTELIHAMQMVEFVRRGQRAQRNTDFSMDALDAMIMQIFAENPQAILRSLITQRRLCYKVFMLHPDAGYRDLILRFIRNERDNAQRSALVRFYLNTAEQPVSAELLDSFMKDKYWRVRLDAYEYRIKHEGAWNGMETLLLSPCYPIREFAAYYLEKSGFDNLVYCREHLPETLLALSDLGTKADTALIRPYLETHPREALIALVRLDDDDSKELVWDAMHDSNAQLAKTAYRLALTHKLYKYSELLPKIKEETNIQRRWRLIRLLGYNVGSELLPVLIRMTRDYAHVGGDIMALIQFMCGYPKHGYYGIFVTQALHDEIKEALQYASRYIPAELNDRILRSLKIQK